MIYLYADGGVISKNPSSIGGTWAWILVNEKDEIINQDSGVLLPNQVGNSPVTNNQTELMAVLSGLYNLDDMDLVEVRSDSQITLGRVFEGYSFNNIPAWMKNKLQIEKKRLINFKSFTYTLMDGHPTKEQIETGFGKRGHMTSKWNVWCDKECGRQAKEFLEKRS